MDTGTATDSLKNVFDKAKFSTIEKQVKIM